MVFVSLRTIPDLKWGTREPVPFRDSELGLVRLRAFGTYGLRVIDPVVFANALVGADGIYTTGALEEYLRSTIVQRLNDWLGENNKSIFDLAGQYNEASDALLAKLQADFQRFGLQLDNFRMNAITPPDEVQKAIDERSRMRAIGNMGDYTRMKAAEALGTAAANPGGVAGIGVGIGAGVGFGQMMAESMRGASQAGGGGCDGRRGVPRRRPAGKSWPTSCATSPRSRRRAS